eukprot:778930-Pyramimonas_sp.AAC.1
MQTGYRKGFAPRASRPKGPSYLRTATGDGDVRCLPVLSHLAFVSPNEAELLALAAAASTSRSGAGANMPSRGLRAERAGPVAVGDFSSSYVVIYLWGTAGEALSDADAAEDNAPAPCGVTAKMRRAADALLSAGVKHVVYHVPEHINKRTNPPFAHLAQMKNASIKCSVESLLSSAPRTRQVTEDSVL